MKKLSVLVLGFALAVVPGLAIASGPVQPKPPLALLDHDENAQITKAHNQVLATHPDLKAEEEKLKAMHESGKAQQQTLTPEQIAAAKTEWQAYQDKLRAEMLKLDPTLKPIFAKLDKERKARATAATPPPPAPPNTHHD